jgi:hypothetical protein
MVLGAALLTLAGLSKLIKDVRLFLCGSGGESR